TSGSAAGGGGGPAGWRSSVKRMSASSATARPTSHFVWEEFTSGSVHICRRNQTSRPKASTAPGTPASRIQFTERVWASVMLKR
ncbi:MAG: hypothetical protein FD161_4278, partial [Limisphaerales bacterium]